MTHPTRWLTLALLAAAPAACSSTGPSDGDQLDSARARWARSGLDAHYQVEISRLCFCSFPGAFPRTALEVVDGQVVRAWDVASGNEIPRGFVSQFPTVPALFDLIAFEIVAKSDVIRVTYHPVHGAPMEIFLDRIRQAVDDELSITIHYLDDGALDAPPHLAR